MSNTSGKPVTSRNNKLGNIIRIINDRGEDLMNVATEVDPDVLSGRGGARGRNVDCMEGAQYFKAITDGVLSMVTSGNEHTSDACKEEENKREEICAAFNPAERLCIVVFGFLAWIVWLVDCLLGMSLHDGVRHHHLNNGLFDLLQCILNRRRSF